MGVLGNLKRTDDVEATEDRLGGGSYHQPTGLYSVTIEMARIMEAASEAVGIVFTFVTDTGEKINITEWISSGKAKGKKNYYEREGKKHYLPGFINVSDICRLTVDKEVSEMDTEERLVEFWDKDAGANKPQKTDVLVELIGEKVTLGLQVERTNQYKDPSKDRYSNIINKVFHDESQLTVVEVEAGADEASFIKSWAERNDADYILDNFDESQAANAAGVSGSVAGAEKKGGKLDFSKK